MNERIEIKNAPEIPGLVFRRFHGEADYPHMAAIIGASNSADQLKRSMKVEDVANNYRHLENCDPQKDMLFAEVNAQVVGYGRVWWTNQADGTHLYLHVGFLHPDWRGKGIASAMLAAGEARLLDIAGGHPKDVLKFFQAESEDTETARIDLLEKFGYKPVRYGTNMVRDLSEPFPEALHACRPGGPPGETRAFAPDLRSLQ